jgi:dihydroneopterin aldolase/2-amino-4-hydroxy-6-hydroxymethyldihydropteridine diphosphokinase
VFALDELIISGLKLFAYHGVNPEEKANGQNFLLDLLLTLDLSRASQTDNLADTVNYATVIKVVTASFTFGRRDLIERAAEVAADAVLSAFPAVCAVELTVKKPEAPVSAQIDFAACRLRRARHSAVTGQETEMAYIALGSNMGKRGKNLRRAVRALGGLPGVKILRSSNIYETLPIGKSDQRNFYNAVVRVETSLSPRALLGGCLGIEAAMGRVRGEQNGPRVIDLDLLMHGGVTVSGGELTLPHPKMMKREFVLRPLCDLCDDEEFVMALEGLDGGIIRDCGTLTIDH